MSKFFNSRYPIVEASMNGGSRLPLALACHEAGVFPSLFIEEGGKQDYEYLRHLFDTTLKEFVLSTRSSNVVLGMTPYQLFNQGTIDIIKSYRISHLEFFEEAFDIRINADPDCRERQMKEDFDSRLREVVSQFKYPVKIIRRTYQPHISKFAHAYSLKGSESAGMNSKTHTTNELFSEQKKLTPDAVLIPYGGIKSATQVADYIRRGAEAVAVGTLFAASKESHLSEAAKMKIINATSSDIIRRPDTGQQTLLLSDLDSVLDNIVHDTDWNRDKSLMTGISTGTSGHLYLGAAVDGITEIKTVKQIVEYLTSEL